MMKFIIPFIAFMTILIIYGQGGAGDRIHVALINLSSYIVLAFYASSIFVDWIMGKNNND